MTDLTKERKLMAQLGTACGCIERCLIILNEYGEWDGQRTLNQEQYQELLAKLEKAKDAVLQTAVAIEGKSDDR